jgi:uncharacterized protein (TIGR01777 family)
VRIVIGGASGFLGQHLSEELRSRGHDVTRLVRRDATSADESTWDPALDRVDPEVIDAADVVVNLAGSPTAGNPHSRKWAEELRRSRVQTTATLARAVAASIRHPAFLAGNGISIYGDHGDQPLTESADSRGHDLLTGVSRDWEAAAQPARDAGARVCILRTSPVLDRRSQPLKLLTKLFKAGLGARLGSGDQYFPVISLRDWVGAVRHLAESDTAAGPFNLCCPVTPTNREFTRALAAAVHRPAFLPAPAAVLSVAAGRLSTELLGSKNAVPQALLDDGYTFRDRDVTAVIAAGLAASA